MKRRTILILLGVVITVLVASLIAFFNINNKEKGAKQEEPAKFVELDSIEEYGYKLEDRDTELYKSTFNKLRSVLSEEKIDYEEYAKLLTELYIIDLYTIQNKMNRYDIGGKDFVLESAKENFELKVQDTLYKYIEDNSYGKRVQELPVVASIGSSDAIATTVNTNGSPQEGYTVTVTWNYEKDLGYDTEAKITLAKIGNKLFITNQSAS